MGAQILDAGTALSYTLDDGSGLLDLLPDFVGSLTNLVGLVNRIGVDVRAVYPGGWASDWVPAQTNAAALLVGRFQCK